MKHYSFIKKNLIRGLFILAFFIFCSDILPENSHPVTRTVVITNCDDYPDIQFVGYVTGPMVGNNEVFYAIQQNKRISRGYKFNKLNVFGIAKEKLQKLGGIEALTEDYVLDKVTPYEILSSATYYVDKNSPIESEKVSYSIVKLSDRTYQAKLTTRVVTYSDNTSETITY